MTIQATGLHFRVLNERIRQNEDETVEVVDCIGQRYIAAGLADRRLEIYGTPGNALGAYLDGSTIFVHGDAQDAVGDTMNDGEIWIDGMAGDALGYAMRGGKIFVHGNVGYRAGIHMKAYEEKQPLLVIGGEAGSFLGEYQAGGTIVVLGLHTKAAVPVGHFCGMGMHGGTIYLRAKELPPDLSDRLLYRPAEATDLEEIRPALERFCRLFGEDVNEVLDHPFLVVRPDSSNPYQQLCTPN